jgi:hypothetical protein
VRRFTLEVILYSELFAKSGRRRIQKVSSCHIRWVETKVLGRVGVNYSRYKDISSDSFVPKACRSSWHPDLVYRVGLIIIIIDCDPHSKDSGNGWVPTKKVG